MGFFTYWRWKRRMRKLAPDRKGACCLCDDPILPGDFVGETSDGRLVHAGFHWTARDKNAFCETAAIGIGHWHPEGLVRLAETAAAEAMRTGKPVVRIS